MGKKISFSELAVGLTVTSESLMPAIKEADKVHLTVLSVDHVAKRYVFDGTWFGIRLGTLALMKVDKSYVWEEVT